MDTKGEVEEITYPSVCFHVDNFDEVNIFNLWSVDKYCSVISTANHIGLFLWFRVICILSEICVIGKYV